MIKMVATTPMKPVHVPEGAVFHGTFEMDYKEVARVGPLILKEPVTFNRMTLIQVIDEFGMDVGIGILMGRESGS